MAVVAPIPRANVRIAVMANAGDLVSLRNAYRKSMPILSSVSAASTATFCPSLQSGSQSVAKRHDVLHMMTYRMQHCPQSAFRYGTSVPLRFRDPLWTGRADSRRDGQVI